MDREVIQKILRENGFVSKPFSLYTIKDGKIVELKFENKS